MLRVRRRAQSTFGTEITVKLSAAEGGGRRWREPRGEREKERESQTLRLYIVTISSRKRKRSCNPLEKKEGEEILSFLPSFSLSRSSSRRCEKSPRPLKIVYAALYAARVRCCFLLFIFFLPSNALETRLFVKHTHTLGTLCSRGK